MFQSTIRFIRAPLKGMPLAPTGRIGPIGLCCLSTLNSGGWVLGGYFWGWGPSKLRVQDEGVQGLGIWGLGD